MANKNKKPVNKKEDSVIYKAMIDMGILIVFFLLLQWVKNDYSNPQHYEAWSCAVKWIAIVCAPLTVAGIVVSFLDKKHRACWLAGAAGALVLGLACLALYLFTDLIVLPYLYFVLVAGCALYLIWLLYPADFFTIALLTTACGGTFYLHGHSEGLGTSVLACYVICILLLAAALLLTKKAAAHDGKLICKKSGKAFRFYSGKAGATPVYITNAVWLACIIAALLIGPVFAHYCVYAAAGYLFIAACYYTIRLN